MLLRQPAPGLLLALALMAAGAGVAAPPPPTAAPNPLKKQSQSSTPGRFRAPRAIPFAAARSTEDSTRWPGALPAAPPASPPRRRLPEGPLGWQRSRLGAVRGVTVGPIETSWFPGRGYGTRASARLLDELARMGTTWVAVTPFGRLWSLDSTRIAMDFEAPYEANRRAIRRFVRQAHARGLRVLLVPHLWVETGGWRGQVDPGTPGRWAAYRESYRRFVLAWARDAAEVGVDMLSVGVECKSWSGRFGPYWDDLVDQVRAVFPGLLTYSANWDEAADVLFWDRLDVVGINAFYPLAERPGEPDEALGARARAIAEEVGRLAEAEDKPVLFVEIGYTSRPHPEVAPWTWPEDLRQPVVDEAAQARAYAALLDAFLPRPWFVGFFVWRYYADLDDISQEPPWGFSPHGKQAERLLRAAFAVRWGADPSPWPWSTPPQAVLPPLAPYPFAGLPGFEAPAP